LRVADSGVWKVDIRDCKVPDGGKSTFISARNADNVLLTTVSSS
jgi:hypothetical protein